MWVFREKTKRGEECWDGMKSHQHIYEMKPGLEPNEKQENGKENGKEKKMKDR